MKLGLVALGVCAALVAHEALAWDPEEDEESAGASMSAQFNPSDSIYGLSLNDGAWIRGTPVYGDFFLTFFRNEIEAATYSGIGITIRLMPHARVAPFAGAGGSYNYALGSDSADTETGLQPGADPVLPDRGLSYGAWHAEAGIRVETGCRFGMVELLGRYTGSFLEGDHNYWLIGIAFGDVREEESSSEEEE